MIIFAIVTLFSGCEEENEKSNEELISDKIWIILEDLAVASNGDVLVNFMDTLIDNPYNEFYYRYKDDRYIFSLKNGLYIQEDGVNNDHGQEEHPLNYDDYQVFQDVDTLGSWSLSGTALNLNPVNGQGSETTHPQKINSAITYTIEELDENYLTISRSGTYNGQSVTLRRFYKKYYGVY